MKKEDDKTERAKNEEERRELFSARLSALLESEYIIDKSKKGQKSKDGRKPKLDIQRFLNELKDKEGLDINYQTLNKYRDGSRFPSSIWDIADLADFFDVSVEYLLGITETQNEVNEKIQNILPLSNDAIRSLKHGNDNAVLMVNALLRDSSQTMLQLLYNLVYDYYVLHNKNIVIDSDQSVSSYNNLMGYAMLLMASIPTALTPEMISSFDKMFENDTRNPEYQGEQDTVQQMSMEEAAEDDPFAPITITGTVKES
jgi:hypothetical protein